jgi:hypothetical protein
MEQAIAPARLGPPHMSPAELEAFRAWLRGGARRYAEFGMGGSTLEAARVGFQTIVAVDSDRRWVESIRAHEEIAPGIAEGRIAALHGDIGPIRAWGAPEGEGAVKLWPQYLRANWAEWQRRKQMPDLVFVDGRFRVASALSALLVREDWRGLRLMVHDMLPERMVNYGPILDCYEPEAQAESLWLLRPRAGVNHMDAMVTFLNRLMDAT